MCTTAARGAAFSPPVRLFQSTKSTVRPYVLRRFTMERSVGRPNAARDGVVCALDKLVVLLSSVEAMALRVCSVRRLSPTCSATRCSSFARSVAHSAWINRRTTAATGDVPGWRPCARASVGPSVRTSVSYCPGLTGGPNERTNERPESTNSAIGGD